MTKRNEMNSLSGYFRVLYRSNQRLLLLCGNDCVLENDSDIVLDIIQDIPRLIPYNYNFKSNKNEIDMNDGLLEYSEEFKYLTDEYTNILVDNYDFLEKTRKIRNKYEHKMHAVKSVAEGSGSQVLFDFVFTVMNNEKKEEIYVFSGEFIKLFKQLNELFSKLQKEVLKYACDNEITHYPYYQRVSRFDFLDFNKIYNSNLLRLVGRAMRDF